MAQNPQPTSIAFNDAFLESQNPALQQRVTVAIVKYTRDVGIEGSDTPNHAARMRLAEQVARQPSMFAQPFTLLLTAQGVTSQSDDNDLTGWVHQVWDTMAGSQ